MRLAYRPEIDGLRAIAVLAVVLGHARVPGFSGGFVGVDVFLVISGYLITSLILGELEAGQFSLGAFYERRARRILPALFLVLIASLTAAWFWFLPRELTDLSRSVLSVLFLVSNHFFFGQSGYFDPAAEMSPLIHTWSLAVEEQFYLLFPVLLLLLKRLGRGWLAVASGTLALLSFSAAQLELIRNPSAAFFLLAWRAWELLLGAALGAGALRAGGLHWSGPLRDLLGFSGLGMIVSAIIGFSQSTIFPGTAALVPTLGTGLVILTAGEGTWIGRLLSGRWIVSIGLVSYSAYLWHQPLFAFARNLGWSESSPLVLPALVCLTFGLAYLSWRFIEVPARSSQILPRMTFLRLAGATFGGVLLASLVGWQWRGFPGRFSESERELLAEVEPREELKVLGYGTCLMAHDQNVQTLIEHDCFARKADRPRLVAFGDSEAAHLVPGLRALFLKSSYQIDQWTAPGCAPMETTGAPRRCSEFLQGFLKEVLPRLSSKDTLIVAANWLRLGQNLGGASFHQALTPAFEALSKTPARVVVFGSPPHFKGNLRHGMVKKGIVPGRPIVLPRVDASAFNALLKDQAVRHGLLYFDPAPALCGSDSEAECLVFDGSQPLLMDSVHLSAAGSERVIRAWSKDPSAPQHGASPPK